MEEKNIFNKMLEVNKKVLSLHRLLGLRSVSHINYKNSYRETEQQTLTP